MAMWKETRNVLEQLYERIGNEWVSYGTIEYELRKLSNMSMETFFKNAIVDERAQESKKEYSLEELVEFINECSGEDLYNCEFNFKVIDGKAYEVSQWEEYCMRGVKD